MKLFFSIMGMALLCVFPSAASAADLVVSYIEANGEADFAPSEARTVYFQSDMANYTITLENDALTVSTQLPFCTHGNAPLEVSATDEDGDRIVDSHYYSLTQWKCQGRAMTAIPQELVQSMFDNGLKEIRARIAQTHG